MKLSISPTDIAPATIYLNIEKSEFIIYLLKSIIYQYNCPASALLSNQLKYQTTSTSDMALE